jgi:hypothetical protein
MAACAVVVIAVLRLISRFVSATLASVLSGASAGLCHAMSALLIKVIIEDVSAHGVARGAAHWPVYALIASTAGGSSSVSSRSPAVHYPRRSPR